MENELDEVEKEIVESGGRISDISVMEPGHEKWESLFQNSVRMMTFAIAGEILETMAGGNDA